MFDNVMIDFETLGVGSKPVVGSFGACTFDLTTGNIENKFKTYISFEDCAKHGFTLSDSTILWWSSRTMKPAIIGDYAKDHVALREFCINFSNWLSSCMWNVEQRKMKVWAKGIDFDVSILKQIYELSGGKYPFTYNASRDVRTVIDLAYGQTSIPGKTKEMISHDPLQDCIDQVADLYAARTNLVSAPL